MRGCTWPYQGGGVEAVPAVDSQLVVGARRAEAVDEESRAEKYQL